MSRNPPEPRQKDDIGDCQCKTCGTTFQGSIRTYLWFKPPKVVAPDECPVCKEVREVEEKNASEADREQQRVLLRQKWLKNCGIPNKFQLMHWNDLDPKSQPMAQQICRQWAQNFNCSSPGLSTSIVMVSPNPGVGKTLLCSLIGKEVILNWKGNPGGATRSPVTFATGPRLVVRLRATFNLPDNLPHHEREEDVYRELEGVLLLILDDVGKEQPRSYRYTQELYWHIIDERVKACLPVVINSRLPLEGAGSLVDVMGKDTVDRLYGMCQGKVINMRGDSYRRQSRQP